MLCFLFPFLCRTPSDKRCYAVYLGFSPKSHRIMWKSAPGLRVSSVIPVGLQISHNVLQLFGEAACNDTRWPLVSGVNDAHSAVYMVLAHYLKRFLRSALLLCRKATMTFGFFFRRSHHQRFMWPNKQGNLSVIITITFSQTHNEVWLISSQTEFEPVSVFDTLTLSNITTAALQLRPNFLCVI